MRFLTAITVFSIFLLACTSNESGKHHADNMYDSTGQSSISKDSSKKSIPSVASAWIGNTDIKINYHSPGVRGRVIWGGLVPYDNVWVTGAHKATTLEIGKEFLAGDRSIVAGKYAIFTIPGKEEWIVILNRNWDQHLADDYKETEDLVRLRVKPKTVEMNERLKYEIDQTGERTATVIISWEKIQISFPIEIK